MFLGTQEHTSASIVRSLNTARIFATKNIAFDNSRFPMRENKHAPPLMRANEIEMPRDAYDGADMMKSAHESTQAPHYTPLTQAMLGEGGDDIGIADDNFLNPLSQLSQNLDTPLHSQGTDESKGLPRGPRGHIFQLEKV